MAHPTASGTVRKAAAKPTKPHKDFPLFPHASGRWAKKIRGKFAYFGKVADDPKGESALALWLEQRDELLAGRKPRAKSDSVTVRDMLNRFMTSKDALVETGELSKRTRDDYFATCDRIGAAFGLGRALDDLRSDDFEAFRTTLAKGWGPVSLGNEINRVRVVFKFAYDSGLLDRPMRYGPGFKRPSRKTLRKERAKKGPRMFEPAEIHKLLKAASVQLRAMILLGVNCGFGNSDCGNLPLSALDLKGGWINFARPKTGIARRCKLWPETVKAIEAAIKARPTPKGAANEPLVFITRTGASWTKDVADSPVTKETRKLLDELGIYRPGLGFYAARHTFETIGGETADQVAVNAIMGHVDSTMAGAYREKISDDRLERVAEHVRGWLFAKAKGGVK